MAHQTTLEERGRVTIPAEVRAAAGWRPGTRLKITVTPEGDIALTAYPRVRRPISGT